MRVSLLAPLHREHKPHHQPGLVHGVARTSSRADNARSATRGKAKRYKITPRKQHAHMIGKYVMGQVTGLIRHGPHVRTTETTFTWSPWSLKTAWSDARIIGSIGPL